MLLDSALLVTFRSRFEAKEPDPKNFVRRTTKLDFYLTVHDIVEERRTKGFAWGGIAADFTELGITMSVSTLKTCFRRASERKHGVPPRTKRPPRRASTPRRGRSETSDSPIDGAPLTAESGLVFTEPPTIVCGESQQDVAIGDAETVGSRKEAPSQELVSLDELQRRGVVDEGAAIVAVVSDAGEAVIDASVQAAEPPADSLPDPPSPDGSGVADKPLDESSAVAPRDAVGAPVALEREDARGGATIGNPEMTGDGPTRSGAPGAADPNHRNVSRLEAMRARASANEKRRLAWVPRADEEL